MGDKAQFLVIVALTLSILLVSITLVIYETTTIIEVSPVGDEWFITLNVEHDFPRALARALAVATSNSQATNETASSDASKELETWRTAFLFAYATEGVKANITDNSGLILAPGHYRNVIMPDNSIATYYIPEVKFNNYVVLRWKFPEAISAISASLRVDCESEGLYGWNYTYVVYLNVTVVEIKQVDSQYNITLIVRNERGPVEDLDLGNFQVSEISESDIDLYIFGSGKYIISFSTSLTKVDITVVDDRGVYVYVNDVPLG